MWLSWILVTLAFAIGHFATRPCLVRLRKTRNR